MNKLNKISQFVVIASFVAVIIGFHSTTVIAQHPCDNFPVTVCNVPSSFQVWQIQDNNTMTTGQTGEPRVYTGETTALNSLWYSWTAPINANYILDTRGTNPNGANNFDVQIALYTGGSTFAGLTQLRANDDWNQLPPNGCNGTVPLGTEWAGSSCVTFTSVAGTTYYFQVDGFSSQVGAFFLNLSLAPLAAEVSVGGRITDNNGSGIPRVRVNLTKPSGEILTAMTNVFGYYKFENLEAGQTYILQVNSKRFQFQNNPRVLTVSENLEGEDFTAIDEFQRE